MVSRALGRALIRRCPRCGGGGLFEHWFKMRRACPRCGLKLEPEEGAFLGSLAINYGVSGLAFIVVLVVWLVVTLPDTKTAPLLITCIAVGLIVPIAFFPFAKTLWAAIDYLLHLDRPRA